MKNKKGVDMTISTMVIIILVMIVLVILVLGFTTGWTNFWKKINIFGGTNNEIQDNIELCQIACAKQSSYDFCRTRNIKDENNEPLTINCQGLYLKNNDICNNIICDNSIGIKTDGDAVKKTPPNP